MTIAAPRFHGFTRAVAQKLLCFESKRNLTVRGFLVSIASDKALPISDDSQAGPRCQASSPITSALDLPSIAIAASLDRPEVRRVGPDCSSTGKYRCGPETL